MMITKGPTRVPWFEIPAAVASTVAALLLLAAPAPAAPPDGQIFFDGDGILDARASVDLCQALEARTLVQVSHLTLCNLAQAKCQQVNVDVNQGLALLTCPNRVAQVTAPSAQTSPASPAEVNVDLDAVSMSTNLRYKPAASAAIEAVYCKSFHGGTFGSRACRKVSPGTGAICSDNSPIVNFDLTQAQCDSLDQSLRDAGVQFPNVDFAVLENFRQVGVPGQTAVGVCPGSTVECVPPDALGTEAVEYRDVIGVQWNQTETCTYITIGGNRFRRC
jgi:hypothetical protein